MSLLLSIAAAYIAFALSGRMRSAANQSRRTMWLAAGSVAMGTGIWSMYYLGMAVMRSTAMTIYSSPRVALSFVAAVLLSTLSLLVASTARRMRRRGSWVRVAAAVLMGLAIASTHYIAMAASKFTLEPMPLDLRNTVRIHLLGEICIAVTAVLVLVVVSRLAGIDKRVNLDLMRQAAMDAAQERYRLATQSGLNGIWDWDCATGKMYLSARCREIVGLPSEDVEGDLGPWLARFHPMDRKRAEAQLRALSVEGRHEFTNEYRICHEDGRWIWTASRGTAVCGAGGKMIRMAGSLTDITEMKSIDPLTGIHNRKSLLDCIERQVSLSDSEGHFALLSIALDEFKRINTGFGQDAGDRVLIEVARRLKDTGARKDGFAVARIEGNEFVVLMGQVKRRGDAEDYAILLQAILCEPIRVDAQEFSISSSVGISFGDASTVNAEGVLEDAGVALGHAKASGVGRVAVFSYEMRERTKGRLRLERDLRLAVPGNQLELWYQPKVLLATGETVGFEALARWMHPERGMISPVEFIPCAEESGLIVEMDRWTMREAVRQLKRWREAGLVGPQITVAVNLSAQQFENDSLVDVVRQTLVDEQLPPSCLTLELTESALVRNSSRAKGMLIQLRQLGVGLDLDDFGTGFSSLSYLHRFPFHTLKIDQSFVRHLHYSQESRAIAQSILQLGVSLNMEVIAEGVETTEQADMLMRLGCLYGQGYLYSRPQPPMEVERLLRTKMGPVAGISQPPSLLSM